MRKIRKMVRWVPIMFLMMHTGINSASAQTTLDSGTPPPSTCLPTDPDYDPRLCVPIDGGVAFLLLVGLAYGIRKYRKNPSSLANRA
jgi:hypothetical protein